MQISKKKWLVEDGKHKISHAAMFRISRVLSSGSNLEKLNSSNDNLLSLGWNKTFSDCR